MENTASKTNSSFLCKARNIFTVFIITLFLSTLALLIHDPYRQIMQASASATQEIPQVSVDPEISIVARYMQARNSKIPVELAVLQAQYIVQIAHSEDLPVELLVGIIETETPSPFDPFSESSIGAAGLMQIYQAPNVEIKQNKKFDIKYNIEIGCIILKGKLETTNGDMSKALARYSGNADNYADRVYTSIGRYSMFRNRNLNSEETLAVNN